MKKEYRGFDQIDSVFLRASPWFLLAMYLVSIFMAYVFTSFDVVIISGHFIMLLFVFFYVYKVSRIAHKIIINLEEKSVEIYSAIKINPYVICSDNLIYKYHKNMYVFNLDNKKICFRPLNGLDFNRDLNRLFEFS